VKGPEEDDESPIEVREAEPIAPEEDLPPVVARMVVEIRSDGTRTLARGAVEDVATGQRVSVQANAPNPVQLSASLARALLKTPGMLSAAWPGLGLRRGLARRLGRLRRKKDD